MKIKPPKEGISIQDMPETDRPREKALVHGIRELTDAELIAIQLRTGTKRANALELAKQLLSAHDNNLYHLYTALLADVNSDRSISGIGEVKRLSVLAAQESWGCGLMSRVWRRRKRRSGYHRVIRSMRSCRSGSSASRKSKCGC